MNDTEPLAARARNFGEIADYYGVSPKVMRRWMRRQGLGDMLKRGSGSYYYTPSDLARIGSVFGDCTHQLGLFN